VIVAGDDPLARRLTRDALQRGGVVVVADASDGREAVELARYYKPDVVVMDAVMPVMSGIDATKAITSELPETRVVVLTRSDDDELGLLGLQAGAVGYLPEGTSVEALPRAVRGAHAGQAVISRALSMRLVERLQSLPEDGIGVRPTRSPLTPREWEVLDLMCAARDTHEIAEELALSIDTVRSHSQNILRKLGVDSRAEAVALAGRLRAP
jgi:DNA-binding NarL/FixJ family response regulator